MSYYKLVIADDEQKIRKGLVNSISWEELGFEVVADFMDGQDVIDYLKDHEVDVVFTDVQRCQVSGLEVADWIRQNDRSIKVVMISGYKEFEYIHEAIRLNVSDYILKPLDTAEIKKTFSDIKKELDDSVSRYGKNIFHLLEFREDDLCALVLQEERSLAAAILSGNDGMFVKNSRQWRIALQGVKQDFVPLLVLRMVDVLYQEIEVAGIRLENDLKKEKILRRIGVLSKEMLPEEMKKILREVFEELKVKKSTEKDNVINKAKKYIDTHLSEDFSVDDLAMYVNLNRSYFSREFKNVTGETVADYILDKRMERAKLLIKEGKYSTEKIADHVGYTDVKYFQRVFKKYTGYTVREYRNLMR